jgi:C_GCAxxG_C_C family probable redox protein
MKREALEKKAFDYFNSGYNCAEAVFLAIVEQFGSEAEPVSAKMASAFCGGIGKSHKEACGALTGGVLALGYLFGRSEPYANFDKAWQLAAEYRTRFIEENHASDCESILKHLGEQENLMMCKQLTGKAAGMLADLVTTWEEERS